MHYIGKVLNIRDDCPKARQYFIHFYNNCSEGRHFFCISAVLHFFEKVLLDTLKTNFGYIKFWVKIQPRSEKSYHFCWISINFVHQNLIKKLFFNEPEWLFFLSGWRSKISCKINAFLRIRSLHAFQKSITTITGSRVVCKNILSMTSYDWNIKL